MQIVHVVGISPKSLAQAMEQAQKYLRTQLEQSVFQNLTIDHSSGYTPIDGYFVTIIATLS